MAIKLTVITLLFSFTFLKQSYSQINTSDTLKICTELKEYNGSGEKIAALKALKWKKGQTLKVKFLEGDDFLQSKVKQYAVEWANYCSIKFEFITTGVAQIRVNFVKGKGSWSIIGKASEQYSINPNTGNSYISNNGTTMNFGWFDSYTTDDEFSRTVIHEFGHALGLVHEHQAPTANISWNKPEVYRYYWETQGWTKEEVDENIFFKYSKSSTQYSMYDKHSIMHYSIPAFLLLDPTQAVGWNLYLSDIDQSFIHNIYSKPKKKKERNEPPHGKEG